MIMNTRSLGWWPESFIVFACIIGIVTTILIIPPYSKWNQTAPNLESTIVSVAPTAPTTGYMIYAADHPALTIGPPSLRTLPPQTPGYYLRPWPGSDVFIWSQGQPTSAGRWCQVTGSDVWFEPDEK